MPEGGVALTTESGSTVPMRQLGRELRQLRELAQGRVEIADVLATMDWTKQKLWRVERGHTRATVLEVQVLCGCYGAKDRLTEVLVALAKESRSKGWYHAYGEVIPSWFELYVSLETAAQRLWEFSSSLVPGPLQTVEYARAVLSVGGASMEVDRRVELRLGRQRRLVSGLLSVDYIVNEAVIRRQVGGLGTMTDQLRTLVKLGELQNVSIRVLPFAAGFVNVPNSFSLLTFPVGSEPDTVYVESLTGALYLYKTSEVDHYRREFELLGDLALNQTDSRNFLYRAAKEISNDQSDRPLA
jgi:hypothetical protein